MPSSETTGFFAHAGDSFREMVALWGERGYVSVKEVKGLCNVWLGGVGQVLLYDRPTLEWFHTSPAEEQEWGLALFGNPVATKALKAPGSSGPAVVSENDTATVAVSPTVGANEGRGVGRTVGNGVGAVGRGVGNCVGAGIGRPTHAAARLSSL